MRTIIFAGIFALSASSSIAQPGTPPAAPATPADPVAAQQSGGSPANLCRELLAFMKAPPPELEAAPAKPAAEAQNAPSDKKEVAANSGPASGQSVQPQSSEKTGSAQDVSGQSGPAHGAPDQNPKSVGAQGSVQNAPQSSSMSAPVPNEPTSPPKETVMAVADAQMLAETNDIAACQGAARKLRLAGVAMPPPLLALTALDLQYQQAGAASPQAPSQQPAARTPQ